jgi:hypothetical protein
MLTSALQKNAAGHSEQKALRPSHSGELRLIDGPAAERETDTIVALRRQTTLHVAARRSAEIGMKSLLAAATILASTALGVGQTTSQTSPVMPSGMGSTSPLGTGFSGFAADLQSATLPDTGSENLTPCSTGNPGTAALTAFDGGGIGVSTNSAISELPGAYGVGTNSLASCNSVSSSGVMGSPNFLTATSNGSGSSQWSPSSSSGSSTSAAISTPEAAGVAVANLGTSGLGTTGLGTTGLGSLPTLSGPSSQATALPARQHSVPEAPVPSHPPLPVVPHPLPMAPPH